MRLVRFNGIASEPFSRISCLSRLTVRVSSPREMAITQTVVQVCTHVSERRSLHGVINPFASTNVLARALNCPLSLAVVHFAINGTKRYLIESIPQ